MMLNNVLVPASRCVHAAGGVIAASLLALSASPAAAQSLTVLPVTVLMAPGQKSASLTIINQGDVETAVQVRVYSWSQNEGSEGAQLLGPTSDVIVSPPLATIAPSAAQVVRLVLRRQPQGQEGTYRILVDQIPTAAAPGMVKIALRLSIPIFAEPSNPVASHVQFHMERSAGQSYLVAVNNGTQHELYRDITLTTTAGTVLKTDVNASPYILAGATRRWRVAGTGSELSAAGALHLTARADGGAVDQILTGAGGS